MYECGVGVVVWRGINFQVSKNDWVIFLSKEVNKDTILNKVNLLNNTISNSQQYLFHSVPDHTALHKINLILLICIVWKLPQYLPIIYLVCINVCLISVRLIFFLFYANNITLESEKRKQPHSKFCFLKHIVTHHDHDDDDCYYLR